MAPRTLCDIFREAAEHDGRCLVAWSSVEQRVVEELSFREFLARAERVALELEARGVRRGDRVAVLSHATVAYYVCAAGVLLAGGAVVNLNWRQPGATLARAI